MCGEGCVLRAVAEKVPSHQIFFLKNIVRIDNANKYSAGIKA